MNVRQRLHDVVENRGPDHEQPDGGEQGRHPQPSDKDTPVARKEQRDRHEKGRLWLQEYHRERDAGQPGAVAAHQPPGNRHRGNDDQARLADHEADEHWQQHGGRQAVDDLPCPGPGRNEVPGNGECPSEDPTPDQCGQAVSQPAQGQHQPGQLGWVQVGQGTSNGARHGRQEQRRVIHRGPSVRLAQLRCEVVDEEIREGDAVP